jgi:hypothetical protein
MDLTEGNADCLELDKKYARSATLATLRRFPAFSFRMLDEAGPMLRLRDFLDRLGDIEKDFSVTDGKNPSVIFSLSASVAIVLIVNSANQQGKDVEELRWWSGVAWVGQCLHVGTATKTMAARFDWPRLGPQPQPEK